MEFKVIIYILIGIGYFIYSVMKKSGDEKQQMPKVGPQQQPNVNPPAHNPLEEIMREIKKRQAEEEARKTIQHKPKPQPVTKPKPVRVKGKDVLVHETQATTFQEGISSSESSYTRMLTDEDKIERGTLKLENEGVYRIETLEEVEAAAEKERNYTYEFNGRDALISSIILERKY